MKRLYSPFRLILLFLSCLVLTSYGGTPLCNPSTGMDQSQAVRTSVPGKPGAARQAAIADLSYANLSASAQARLQDKSSRTASASPITIERTDYLNLAQAGNQISQQRSVSDTVLATMNIGQANDQQPQNWTLPAGTKSILSSKFIGDFITPEQVPADLRIPNATHIIRLQSREGILYRAYQLKDTEVESLGYSVDSLQGPDFKEDNDDLSFSAYSDVPLNIGDEFELVDESISTNRSERTKLITHVHYDAYGVLQTPDGTFDALRFTSRDTSFFYQGTATVPSSQSVNQRVGWVTKEGTYFDGRIQAYDPATGQATLVDMNYQTIAEGPGEVLGGADLTPTLSLPQANFAASGSDATHTFTATIQEVIGKATTDGAVVVTLTIPLGYAVTFDSTLTSITVSGGSANPVTVNNGSWNAKINNSHQLTLTMKAGDHIPANGQSVLGFSLSRTAASAGTSNITINVSDDPNKDFDSNPQNNIYARSINSL